MTLTFWSVLYLYAWCVVLIILLAPIWFPIVDAIMRDE